MTKTRTHDRDNRHEPAGKRTRTRDGVAAYRHAGRACVCDFAFIFSKIFVLLLINMIFFFIVITLGILVYLVVSPFKLWENAVMKKLYF